MALNPQTSSPSADWGNYWQGRASAGGAALVGIERNAELEVFWRHALDAADKGSPLLDVATGAGTVLKTAAGLGFNDLTGLDVSADALATLQRELPDVRTVVASASEPPFEERSFATVTSQFGLEYAGAEAAVTAIAPLLCGGGMLIAVCHLASGAIAEEVFGKLKSATAIHDSQFVPRAKSVFQASDAGFPDAAEAFRPAQDTVLAMAKRGDRLAAHLYAGTQQLHERRSAYTLADVTGWLDGMAGEIDAFMGRMQSMLDAAMSVDEAERLVASLRRMGLTAETPEILEMGGSPAALVIKARR